MAEYQVYLTKEEFKGWLEKYNEYRLSLEHRLSRLESRQYVQIGLIVVQLIATAALFMRLA